MVKRWEPTTDAASRPARGIIAAAAAAVMLAAAGAVAVVLATAPPGQRTLSAVIHASLVLVPAGVGLAVQRRTPNDRFAWALVVAGVLFSLTALADSTTPELYSVGRVVVWLVEPAVVFLLLSFPSGHLSTQAERRLFHGVLLVVLLLYVPTLLVIGHFPEPTPWSTCGVACPGNSLEVTASQPAIVEDLVRPLRETLIALAFLVTTVVIVRRSRAAGPMLRRALIPVAVLAGFRTLAFAVYSVVRAIDPGSSAIDALGWIYVLSLPLIALSFGLGLVLRRMYAGVALHGLALELRGAARPAQLQQAMARALEDPSLRLLRWREGEPGYWVDQSGSPVGELESLPDVTLTEVGSDGDHLATLIHDGALTQDPILTQAAIAYGLVALENGWLVEQLRVSLSDLTSSRARLVGIADETRRAIERDLHDGAQQRLIGLRIHLSTQAERLAATDPDAAAAMAALGEEVEEAIDDLRALAHGIYPALLVDRGLGDALRAVARVSAVPASVEADGVGRYRSDIESTVYFACLEAIQNAEKHAAGATHIAVSVAADGPLTFSVCDDGAGFDTAGQNGSFQSLHDRLDAIGGSIEVRSTIGHGTCVVGHIPEGRAQR